MAYTVKVTGQYDTVDRTEDGDDIRCKAVDRIIEGPIPDLETACEVLLANKHRQRYSGDGFTEVEVIDADGKRVAWLDANLALAIEIDAPAPKFA